MPAKTPELDKFYKSSKWRKVRQLKLIKERGICERCGNRGYEVHHKTYLTNDNLSNQHITLGIDNLELLCHDCHNREHERSGRQVRKDIYFDENGDIAPHIERRKI